MKKILIITPKFPIPTTGACEQERLAGITQLKQLGYDVKVVAKFFDWQDQTEIYQWGEEQNIEITLLKYKFNNKKLSRILNPLNWDGAAYEYKDKETQAEVKKIIEDWKPDIAWFDYSYLWPLYKLFQQKNIPVITRSINFEPIHFLQEDGINFMNLIKFFPKVISEIITVKKSDYIFAITPKEKKIYQKLGARNINTLPLRSLPKLLENERVILEKDKLHLFFMGAGFSVPHIRQGGEFVIKKVAPALEKKKPGKFIFHILGKGVPEDLKKYCINNIKAEGFVPNLKIFLNTMDIAVIPSLLGAGMQQKIFEPLCLGIPTVTSSRGLANYPFEDNKHLLLAKSVEEYVEQIIKLQDINLRKKLSKNSLELCKQIFSQKEIDKIVTTGIKFVE